MIIKIGKYDYTEVWDGVLYKKLSNYPQVSDWEIRTIIEFIDYESMYGRKCQLICEQHAGTEKDAVKSLYVIPPLWKMH